MVSFPQLHFWAHWDGCVQLSPCPCLSVFPQTLFFLCLVGKQGHAGLSTLDPHEAQWKLLFSFKM